jgi:hypothetical protein
LFTASQQAGGFVVTYPPLLCRQVASSSPSDHTMQLLRGILGGYRHKIYLIFSLLPVGENAAFFGMLLNAKTSFQVQFFSFWPGCCGNSTVFTASG